MASTGYDQVNYCSWCGKILPCGFDLSPGVVASHPGEVGFNTLMVMLGTS